MQTNNLFEEFSAVDKTTWVSSIEKYLKGKSAESLRWEVEEGLSISPIQRAADITPLHLPSNRTENSWAICEKIVVTDYSKANKEALEALAKGCNALYFELATPPTAVDIQQLLEGVHFDMVALHFAISTTLDVASLIEQLKKVKKSNQLNISLACDFKERAALLPYLANSPFATFRAVTLSIESASTSALSQQLKAANDWIAFLLEKGVSITRMSHFFRFEFLGTTNYFVDIARLRAFRRLWLGILEAYSAKQAAYPFIYVETNLVQDNKDQYWNMIASTTQTMSAAIGGANSICVLPSDGLEQSDSFSKRIARNVQHILQSESHFNRVVDPAQGAYYIEKLTAAIAQKAWQQFCN